MILHVDMDAFYASIEQRENPELKGKPVIVGADPRGRGVVSTCSYEARPFGVHSAMPIREAFRLCPHGIYLPVRMGLYLDVSRQIMEILEQFSPSVEPLSIDEAFLDLAGCESLHESLNELGTRIKTRIHEITRLDCTIGIAPNKFLAKLATNLGKPRGLRIIRSEDVGQVLDPLPVTSVFGVGEKTEERLRALGIVTVGDLARTPLDILTEAFGPASAVHMKALANGEDDRNVEPSRERKQLGSERTFPIDITSPTELKRHLLDLCDEVGIGLRRRGIRARVVRLKIRTHRFETKSKSKTLRDPTDSTRVIYRAALDLFDKADIKSPVRLVGVTAAELLFPGDERQGTLFEPQSQTGRIAEFERAADSVRARFGRGALRPATLVEPSKTRDGLPKK